MSQVKYCESDGLIINGDCRDILLKFPEKSVDLTLTDPPYGIEGGSGGQLRNYCKADYAADFSDTPEYIKNVCVPVIIRCLNISKTTVLTPGARCLCSYPQPDDVGDFYSPAASRRGRFGFANCSPIFYYGYCKNAGKGASHTSYVLTEHAPKINHPCPKPLTAWTWLLKRSSEKKDIILDPFLGSGTTAVAASQLGRKFIGIEISEEYCKLAADRVRASKEGMKLKEYKAGQKTLFNK